MIFAKKLFFLLGLCSIFQSAFSQQNDNDPFYLYENLPASPEVSKLGQYGETSVTAYNGKVNVSIPLYQLNFEGLNIPLELNHNSSGVLASAEASWVGLNWNLSTQFSITRSVNSKDDLDEKLAPAAVGSKTGFIYNNIQVNTASDLPHMNYDDVVAVHQSFEPTAGGSRQLDLQPDIFTVSLFGRSYKFRMQKKGSGSIVETEVFNNNNVVITFNLLDKSFEIKDESGFLYKFSTKEFSTSFSSIPGPTANPYGGTSKADALSQILEDVNRADETVITSWNLDKITSPRGEVLNFTYQRGAHFTFPSFSGTVTVQDNGIVQSTGHSVAISNLQLNATTTIIENAYLKKISGSFGEIEFVLGAREDLMDGAGFKNLLGNGTFVLYTANSNFSYCHGTSSCSGSTSTTSSKLNSLVIKDFNGVISSNINFTYTYFNPLKVSASDKSRYLRLKLDEVQINEKKYKFIYNTVDILPAKDTYDTDFWGFYNGAGNLTNIPNIGRFITSEITHNSINYPGQSFFNFSGAKKNSNFTFGKGGLLTKIIYPTGGYSELEYEPHQALVPVTQPYTVTASFPNSQRLRWTSLIDEDKYNFTYQYLKKSIDPNYNLFTQVASAGGSTSIPVQKNIGFSLSTSTAFTADGGLKTQTGWGNISYYASYPLRVVENINNPSEQYVLFNFGDGPSTVGVTVRKQKTILLPAGDYRVAERYIPYNPSSPGAPVVTVEEEIDGSNLTTPYSYLGSSSTGSSLAENFEVGGARIKSITLRDNNGDFLSKKTYSYDKSNTSTGNSSSGILMDALIYFSKAYGFQSYNPRGYSSSPLKLTSYNQIRGNLSAQGSHIGYTSVTERDVDSNNNAKGHIERNYFNSPNDYFKESFSRSYFHSSGENVAIENTIVLGLDPKLSFEHLNGKILQEKFFNCSGEEIFRTTNEYITLTGSSSEQYYAAFMPLFYSNAAVTINPGSTIPAASDNSTYYGYRIPGYYGSEAILRQSETIEFLGAQQLTNRTFFTYNALTHHLVSSEKFLENNKSQISKLFYPYDSEVYSNPLMSNLRAENRIASPVKIEDFQNTNKLNTRLYNYSNSSDTGYKTLVSSISEAKENLTLQEEVRYEKFDSKGNVIQLRKADGSPVAYIYGYNYQHIIAKVENATYNDVSSFVSNLQSLSNNDNTTCNQSGSCNENTLRTALNNLRAQPSLNQALITTYTYNPLVGVTSITNPSGTISYFEYDSYNRVKNVRDQSNNIIEEYNYNIVDGLIMGTTGSVRSENYLCNSTNLLGVQEFNFLPETEEMAYTEAVQETTSSSLNSFKPLNGIIDIESIETEGGRRDIFYVLVPFGGSGEYEYSWKIHGQDQTPFSTDSKWTNSLDCSIIEKPEVLIICEVRDVVTGSSFLAELRHPVSCNN